jgi:hypothetical protein
MRGRGAAFAASALVLSALLTVPGPAGASHARPRGATPVRVPLVPAYKGCVAPNRTHGAPLASPSCNPPGLLTAYTTIGTPDANGAGANSIGSIRFDVIPGDVRFTMSLSDIRCAPATAATVCSSANSADGPDYSGELQTSQIVRITDHYNGPALTDAATMQDFPFPFTLTCANTVSTSQGALCEIATSANAVVPGVVRTGQRAIWELGQIYAYDGGAGGDVQTPDGGVLVKQGLFVP